MNHPTKRKHLLLASTLFCSFFIHQAFAVTPEQDVPFQGMTQEQVKNVYGEPNTARKPVGKPPITRWDYDNYSVYFEGNQVIHSFLHQHRLKPSLNPKPAAPAQQASPAEQKVMNEMSSDSAQDMEEGVQIEEVEAQVEADMQEVEQNMEAEAEKTAELAEVEEVEAEEQDLNYEEKPDVDFGKWGY